MKKIQITAKTVQKAIEQGLKELNATQEEVDIKILEEGGFFKKAKVELILDKEVEERQAKEEKVKEQPKEEKEVQKPKKEKKEKEKEEVKEEVKETKEDMFTFGTKFLTGLFEKMNVQAEITYFEADGSVTFNTINQAEIHSAGQPFCRAAHSQVRGSQNVQLVNFFYRGLGYAL